MYQNRQRCFGSVLLVFVLPVTLLAEFSRTTSLPSGTGLNLETGATGSSGADLLWTGNGLAPQGKAKAAKLPFSGVSQFDDQAEALLRSLVILTSAAVIPAGSLTVNSILLAITNNGNLAKILVTAVGNGSITLRYTTYGVSSTPGAPLLKSVLNNSSRIPRGAPNYGIAPSSLFVVSGSGLADPAELVLQSSQPPGLPLTLNGASIAVVVNGVTVRPPLYYTSPTQLAAVLPANTPVGAGTLRVTHGSATSDGIAIQVVPAAVGINTYDLNTGVATDAVTGAVLTLTNSGSPGQTIVLWATGLGSDPADSDTTFTTTPHGVNTPLQIYVGGVPATVLYAGASGYPGVNQINVVIPDTAPTGCWISLAAVAGNVPGNVATLPINRGGGACLDVVTGLNGTQIFNPNGLSSFRTGFVGLILASEQGNRGARTVTNAGTAAFQKYTALSYNTGNAVTPGGCVMITPATLSGLTGLDVGTITLTGPGGLSVTLASQLGIKGAFSSNLPAGAIPATGGTFTFQGSGGADVGAFTSTLTFANPLMTWTNPSVAANIDRTRGLTVTWTGGNPGSYITITGGVTMLVDERTLEFVTASFICRAPVEAGQFTVPSYILMGVPAGSGSLLLQNNIYSTLPASGLDISFALGSNSYSTVAVYGNSSTSAK